MTNREVVIKVGGMMCATCVQTIEAALRALPGVVAANVNLANEQAYVTYNPSVSAVADMKQAIEDAGYQYLGIAGEISDEAEKAARDADLHDKLMRFSIGFAVSIPLMVLMWVPTGIPMQVLAYGYARRLDTGLLLRCIPHLQGRVDGAQKQDPLHGCHVHHGYGCRVCRKRDGHVLDRPHS